jgi:hypothetical protein
VGRLDSFCTRYDWSTTVDVPEEPVRVPTSYKPKGTYDRGDPAKDSGRKLQKKRKKKR